MMLAPFFILTFIFRTILSQDGVCNPNCCFFESSITSATIKKWPKSCREVCGNIVIDENTDVTESELQEYLGGLAWVNGTFKIQNSKIQTFDFLGSLTYVHCDKGIAIVSNNSELTDLSALRWMDPDTGCLWEFVNNSKLDMSTYDDHIFISNMDSYIYGNMRDNDCANIRITPESLPYYTNCPFIVGGENGGLTITNVSDTTDLSALKKLKKISGKLRVFGTTLTNLSFLSNLQSIEDVVYRKRVSVEIYDNPNLRKLGLDSLKTVLPDAQKFKIFLQNNHPEFCFTTNEVQVFSKSFATISDETEVSMCPDLDRKDKQKVCYFWNLEYLGEDCQHVIGDVLVNRENEKDAGRLRNVTNIYGSITVRDTEELVDLSFLANLKLVARVGDSKPSIRILSNKKLLKIDLPKMKTPPFPLYSAQYIMVDGNWQEILKDRQECMQFYKKTGAMVKYNGRNCMKLPKKDSSDYYEEYGPDYTEVNGDYLYNYGEYYYRWDFYDEFDFGSEENKQFFYSFIDASKRYYDVASFFSFFVNLFHLLILTRKELRSNLVYMVMICICFCDILQSFGNISQIGMAFGIFYPIEDCFDAYKYSHIMVNLLAKTMQIMSRKCSAFLVLYVAIIRALSVIFPMSNFVAIMAKVKSGVLVMILVGAGSFAWSMPYYMTSQLIKVEKCPARENNSVFSNQLGLIISRPVYIPYKLTTQKNWRMKYLMIDGIIASFITVTYVLVAISLAVGIGIANRRRKKLRTEKLNVSLIFLTIESLFRSSNTSLLVLVMAITFFIAEVIYAALYIITFVYFRFDKARDNLKELDAFPLTLQMMNTAIHAVICFAMSSQYRDTVRGIFWIKKTENKGKPLVVISAVESSSEPATTSVFRKRSAY